jgi:hypothetical protein
VQEIHAYRQAHGIRDPERALGARPSDGLERAQWLAARRRLRERQLELGLERALERRLGRELGLSLEL